MGFARALTAPGDAVLSNHRNHGHFLTCTGDFAGLLAEVMGREGGAVGGIGGSQHLTAEGFHSSGVQGGMTALGVGLALARKLTETPGVIGICIGDGTLGQGLLYESMNLAAVWKLRVLFIVENNRIAQTTATAQTTGGSIRARGEAFGLRVSELNDAAADFFQAADEIVARVRLGGGPEMAIVHTERMGPHSKGDDPRSAEEMDAVMGRDPLAALGRSLDQGVRERLERENADYIASAREAAMASPEASRLIAEKDIYRPVKAEVAAFQRVEGNVRSQINRALGELLESDPRVVLLGEDMHDPYGGAFKVTAGLSTRYPDRVISTPISEAGVVGAGVGLAMAGLRPVVEIMFADFLTLCMDQLYNHAVKFPGMFEDVEVPLVIRTPSGGRRGYGPTHSQSPEHLAMAVPGLTVVFPSHRHNVGELLKRAVLNWPNPSVVFEHKLLYGEAAEEGGYRILARDERDAGLELFPTLAKGGESPDLTIVAYGGMLPHIEKLAAALATEQLDVEIVVPSLLSPLPRHQLAAHLAGRDRVLVAEETYGDSGLGTYLGALLAESGYRGRFVRIGTPPVPIPAARSLEERILPGGAAFDKAVFKVLGL